jgi:hypothetical protein
MTANQQVSTSVERTQKNFTISGIFLVLLIAFLGLTPALMAQTAAVFGITTTDNKTAICQGASIELCATDGYESYKWSNGASTRCITINTGNTYSVVATDVNGGTATSSQQIIVNKLPVCDITGKLSFCPGGSTELCAPEGFASYVWFPLATTRCVTVKTGGTYCVKVTDANGCHVSHCEEVVVNTPPPCDITGATSFCEGGSTELCAPEGLASYSWSNGATTRCITVKTGGTYTVTVTNADGCTCSKSVEVTVKKVPVCDITGKLSFCAGGSTELCAPDGFASYVWLPLATTRCITVTAAGTYCVKVTAENGCTASHCEEVKVNTPPPCNITGETSFCEGGSTQLCATDGLASYSWNTGATSRCITVKTAGTYIVTVTDANGCSSTKSIQVTVKPIPTCDIVSSTTAAGTIQLCATAGMASYSWSNGATTPCITISTSGTYSVTITNGAGCRSTCSKTITSCNGFRTQTMGGWGAPPNGNNPGVYVHANFAGAFPGPDYLTIGCATGFKLKLTSAQAITDFLPSGSTGRALTANLTNPGEGYSNVLAGQLVAATLSVRFDQVYANFSPSTTLLKDLVINAGTFQGWTVAQLLAEANKKIGGCASPYAFSDFTEALNAINNNYDDGTKNQGNLRCPAATTRSRGFISTPAVTNAVELKGTGNLLVNSYPNPAVSSATIKFKRTDKASHAVVAIYTMDGRKVATLFDKDITGGVTYEAALSTRNLQNGVYVYKVSSGNELIVRKLVIAK